MPTEAKPLFRVEALRPRLHSFILPNEAALARSKVMKWAKLLKDEGSLRLKESELLADFLRDVFVELLGYKGPADNGNGYTFSREKNVLGDRADAAIGRFSLSGTTPTFTAALEGKGPRDPLDRPFAGRKQSAVDQALGYAVDLKCDWYMVTNFSEIRLYNKTQDRLTFEQFRTQDAAQDDAAFKKLVYLLGAERVLPKVGGNHLDTLLADSKRIGLDLTKGYYKEYAELRFQTFQQLRQANPGENVAELLAATQKILDRILFIAFCEDRGLLPAEIIARAYQHKDPFNPRPIWENFKGLFRSVDEGNPPLEISKYNGGLFAPNSLIDRLKVPDAVCRGFDRLAAYEYGQRTDDENAKHIDVEILGHIFEQSISDLEQLQRAVTENPDATPAKEGPSKRKKEGAFYTPAFVTRYIVTETLKPVLAERFEALRQRHQEDAPKTAKKSLEDPLAYDLADLKKAQREALARFWNAWLLELETIRIVDPSCGSGAFLIEAFEQMHVEYDTAAQRYSDLTGETLHGDTDKQILQNNLFGMDLNEEAVEICRLSLWIKTAEKGKVLTSLDHNIKQGNSVMTAPLAPREAWKERFPAVFAQGGFDVVIGNPPYVRQEWISKDKPFLQEHYQAFDGVADLYVYFYELGVNLLRPGGRLGFISSNSFVRAAYGENLRRLLSSTWKLEQILDLGDTQVFADAKDVYPVIAVISKNQPVPDSTMRCVRLRKNDNPDDLPELIKRGTMQIQLTNLDTSGWRFEEATSTAIRDKLFRSGLTLGMLLKKNIFRGVVTGCNEAFLIDDRTRESIIAEDKTSCEIIKKFIRGQNLNRWNSPWANEWIIFARRGIVIDAYPAVRKHLEKFRKLLDPRPIDWVGNAWEGRKPGSYKWYELQDPVEYWQAFEHSKIMYPDIAKVGEFSIVPGGIVGANTTYMLPTTDHFLLGVLNSRAAWFALSGISIPFGERAGDFRYRLFNQYMERIPVPTPTDKTRKSIEEHVQRLIFNTSEMQNSSLSFLDWLKVEFDVAKASQKLQDVASLDVEQLVAEVKKARGKQKPLTVAGLKALKDEYARSVIPLQTLAAEAHELERQVSDLVNEAYGLTPDEIQLMWDTAPPHMSGERPNVQ